VLAPIQSVGVYADHQVRLSFRAQVGSSYYIEAMEARGGEWVPIGALKATGEVMDYTDLLAGEHGSRFYRVRQTPFIDDFR
jgi:hypothetical protein